MGERAATEINGWLTGGGMIVTASERAARSFIAEYHRARLAEGLAAWAAPSIYDSQSFVRETWQEHHFDGRMVLNTLQEQAVWARVVTRGNQLATLLEGPKHRVAALAMEAHRLLCFYAPQFLEPSARSGWVQDPRIFSSWLAAFDEECRAQKVVSAARLPLRLAEALEAGRDERPRLLLAGFDRIPPVLQRMFDAYGQQRLAYGSQAAERVAFYETTDPFTEAILCAQWCKRQLQINPAARLLVVTQEIATRRGEIERAFLRAFDDCGTPNRNTPPFEFSLGVPLKQVELARGAQLILHWLHEPLEEQELDWLLASGFIASAEEETRALTAFMRDLRRRGWQRTRWRLDVFLRQRPGAVLPAAWVERITDAKTRLDEAMRVTSDSSAALSWAALASQLLAIAGWPGQRVQGSAEFQAMRQWERMLDGCASLGFDGAHLSWRGFLDSVDRAMSETLYSPESQDAPILIAGPAETAGLTADAIWFLGATEDAWPASGAAHPLLPLDVQREAQMPHATAQLDWELASEITGRLLASAPEISFSYARQSDGIDMRSSRIVKKIAGTPQMLPAELHTPKAPDPATVEFIDCSRIPFAAGSIQGGADVLTAQSRCPFHAFATARLGARGWEPAEASLTAAQRGQLLHAVMHAVWSGPPAGIRGHAELTEIADVRGFVAEHVRHVMREKTPANAREEMPKTYLELEAARLTDLVAEWLRYEVARVPFTVEQTERKAHAAVGGLALDLRLDRVDRLENGSLLVIDYKTGDVSPQSWDLPRPDDVQLPLYAGYGLSGFDGEVGGLVFAKLRAGEHCFAGRVTDAKTYLLQNLGARNSLVRKPLTIEELEEWRGYIEKLALDFLAGRAEVSPREYPKTCERCGLQTLCRVLEHPPVTEEEGEEAEENGDE